MRYSLSTNWCSRRFDDGRAIAAKALELGFGELELGYNTVAEQVEGFKAMLDQIPVGSIHAFCPVPLSAPHGYPELYPLATRDEESRRMAVFQVLRNVRFAAEMGADTVVLHAGRVSFGRLFDRIDSRSLRTVLNANGNDVDSVPYRKVLSRAMKRRSRRGRALLDVFCRTLDEVLPVLESCKVVLALENLPYLEGFPDDGELACLLARFGSAPVKGWFDTGHDRVLKMHGWSNRDWPDLKGAAASYAGMHLNDVKDFNDDHLAPGMANVDFAGLKDFAQNVRHVVFEPAPSVSEEDLLRGLALVRSLWGEK